MTMDTKVAGLYIRSLSRAAAIPLVGLCTQQDGRVVNFRDYERFLALKKYLCVLSKPYSWAIVFY